MNFKEWLKINEVGTMSSGATGGVGDVAMYKMPVGAMIKRSWCVNPVTKKKKLKA